MASVRYEFITLGKGGWGENVIRDVIGTPGTLEVTSSATADGSRPTVPDGNDGTIYVRLTAIGGPVHVSKGKDVGTTKVTASLTNGLRLVPDMPEVLAVSAGDKLSFIGEE